MSKTIVLIMSRASGAGKSYLEKHLSEDYPELFKRVISCTTRQPREGEVPGQSFYYMTKPNFTGLITAGHMIQFTEFADNFYGSLKSEYESGHPYVLLVITPESAGMFTPVLQKVFPEARICNVYFNITNEKIWLNLRARGDKREDINERLAKDTLEEQFRRSGIEPDYVVSDDMLTPDLPKKFKEWLENEF